MFALPAVVERGGGQKESTDLWLDSCVAAGYTGRNQDAVEKHISELQRLGVATPYATPALYWISPARITTRSPILVVGEGTSPEVEFFLGCNKHGTYYVTVASDHTDRDLEAVSVAKSKQICDKIIGDIFWRVDDIADHWDQIGIVSQVLIEESWQIYQRGTLGDILPYTSLLNLLREESSCGDYPGLFSGTIPLALKEPAFTSACRLCLADPVLNRQIEKDYRITVLPDRS